jgi:hypothetical protein
MSLHETGDNAADQHLRPTALRQLTYERRQRSISAFKSSEALAKLMERKGTINAAVEVSTDLPYLTLDSKTNMSVLQSLYVGLAAAQSDDGEIRYAIALNDGTYNIHCQTHPSESLGNSSNESSRHGSGVSTPLSIMKSPEGLANGIIEYLSNYREKHLSKPMGASLTLQLANLCPHLAVRLWTELDIVPFVFQVDSKDPNEEEEPNSMPLDQQAEWMARKTVKQFSVRGELPVHFGDYRQVLVDLDGRVRIAELESFDTTINAETTGAATMHYANSLKENKTRIAFFNRYGSTKIFRHV